MFYVTVIQKFTVIAIYRSLLCLYPDFSGLEECGGEALIMTLMRAEAYDYLSL